MIERLTQNQCTFYAYHNSILRIILFSYFPTKLQISVSPAQVIFYFSPFIIFLCFYGFCSSSSPLRFVNFPVSSVDFSMESSDSRNKLHSRLRLWEFPDQYIIEPADGSGAPCLEISRVDASMKLIGSFLCSKHLGRLIPFFCFYWKMVAV